jgi:hypothetical protein
MKTFYLVLAFTLPLAFTLAANPAQEKETRCILPSVKEMLKLAPDGPLVDPSENGSAGSALDSRTGFDVIPGWPYFYNGSAVHGGMLVDMDGDSELELVQVTGGTAHALNPDGSAVPGWPQSMGDSTFSPPAFGDIDGDGEGEVVIHTFYYGIKGKLFAFNRDGTLVSGFPKTLGGTVKGPTLGDLDGDDDLEILSLQNVSNQGKLYAIEGDGSVRPGWPKDLDHVGAANPSVGDIDGVPGVEIVALSFISLYVYDSDGNLKPGFPFTPGGSHTFNYTAPVLADLDKDGDREIVVCTSKEGGSGGRAYVLHHDGTVATGWPKPLNYPCYIPASVVDLDDDGWLDILTGDVILSPIPTNSVYAWDRLGNPLPGFPISGLDALHAQMIVADFDDDGMLEFTFDQNLSTSDYQGYNHDATPMTGWPLSVLGSSFLGCLCVNDIDGDGTMDLAGTGSLIQPGNTQLYLWSSEFPYDVSRAPLPTYQYNLRRDGIADPVLPTLVTDTDTLSTQGGTVEFLLKAGMENTGRTYLLLGSTSGTEPGQMLPGGLATLPLNWDWFTDLTVNYLNSALFTKFYGKLDELGQTIAYLNWPGPSMPPGAVGVILYFSYCLNAPFDFASNPVEIEIVP